MKHWMRFLKHLKCCLSLSALVACSTFAQTPFTCTTNNGVITITGYDGPTGPIVIPTNINGFPVAAINKYAFRGSEFSPDTAITGVTIPNCVTSIGDEAFLFCVNLGTLNLGNGVTNFGDSAFAVCGLTNVNISNGAVILGREMFAECSRLESIVIPSGITNIPDYTFEDCGLTNIIIPGSVTSIGDFAFDGNPLGCVAPPNSVSSIGGSAYYNCENLTNVIIPASVTQVGSQAFGYDESLTNIFFLGNAPTQTQDQGGPFASEEPYTTLYFLPGTTGWTNQFSEATNVLWNPSVPPATMHNGQFGVTVTGNTNIPIQLQACTNLTSPVWTPLTNVSLTNGSFYYSEPVQSNSPSRFYRVVFP